MKYELIYLPTMTKIDEADNADDLQVYADKFNQAPVYIDGKLFDNPYVVRKKDEEE